MNRSIIGGTDGPTAVFLAGSFDMSRINIFGLIFVVLMLIPGIICAFKFKNMRNENNNKILYLMDKVGFLGCLMLMVFNVGTESLEFWSLEAAVIYFIGNALLMVIYWILWMLYFIKPSRLKWTLIAEIPADIFLLSGITTRNYPLIVFSVIFRIGHIYSASKTKIGS